MPRIIGLWVFTILTTPLVDPLGVALLFAMTYSLTIAAVFIAARARESHVRRPVFVRARQRARSTRSGVIRH